MALSVFDEKSVKPSKARLAAELGRTSSHWDSLVEHLAQEFPPLDQTWTYGGADWGWTLRLKQKKRTVLYMTPCRRHFVVGFALGEKAVKAARGAGLSQTVLSVIRSAKKYAEGRAVRLEIRNKKDLESAKRLATIKMAK